MTDKRDNNIIFIFNMCDVRQSSFSGALCFGVVLIKAVLFQIVQIKAVLFQIVHIKAFYASSVSACSN